MCEGCLNLINTAFTVFAYINFVKLLHKNDFIFDVVLVKRLNFFDLLILFSKFDGKIFQNLLINWFTY